MEKTGSAKIYWFVEPKNAYTNKVIAQQLLAFSSLIVEIQELLDNQSNPHLVFEASDYSFVNRLYKDRKNLNLDFAVFSRQGKNARLRLWTLGSKK